MTRNINLIAASLALGTFAGAAQAATYQAAVLADNPLYYWTFDEASGDVINLGTEGENGGTNNLTSSGTSSRTAGGTNAGGLSLGTAGSFGAVSDRWESVGNLSDAGLSKYVIEFWINDTAQGGSEYLFEHGQNAASGIMGFGNNLEVFTGANRTGAGGPNVSDSNWNHVVFAIDSAGGHQIYVNGVLDTDSTETLAAWAGTQEIAIGDSVKFPGNPFTGLLDEFAVYDVGNADLATFAEDIADHYNVPEPGSLALIGLGGLFMLRRHRTS